MPVTPSLLSGLALSAACGSGSPDEALLRCAQDDSQDTAQVRSREAFSPKVYYRGRSQPVSAPAVSKNSQGSSRLGPSYSLRTNYQTTTPIKQPHRITGTTCSTS